MEKQFDKTEIPEIVTFNTDFGVKFGTFICFDILFSVPALNLTRTLGISNIIFTTAWFSEVPFLTGIFIFFTLHIIYFKMTKYYFSFVFFFQPFKLNSDGLLLRT